MILRCCPKTRGCATSQPAAQRTRIPTPTSTRIRTHTPRGYFHEYAHAPLSHAHVHTRGHTRQSHHVFPHASPCTHGPHTHIRPCLPGSHGRRFTQALNRWDTALRILPPASPLAATLYELKAQALMALAQRPKTPTEYPSRENKADHRRNFGLVSIGWGLPGVLSLFLHT